MSTPKTRQCPQRKVALRALSTRERREDIVYDAEDNKDCAAYPESVQLGVKGRRTPNVATP